MIITAYKAFTVYYVAKERCCAPYLRFSSRMKQKCIYLQDWIIYFPYVLAPSLFLVGSILLIWENSHSLYKGWTAELHLL